MISIYLQKKMKKMGRNFALVHFFYYYDVSIVLDNHFFKYNKVYPIKNNKYINFTFKCLDIKTKTHQVQTVSALRLNLFNMG